MPGLEAEQAVFLANMETAVNVVLDAAPRLGERVVVFGQGVVGLLVGRLLRQAGAGLMIAVEPIEARRALARRFGADATLEPGPGLPAHVRELTGGQGADIAIEASGSGTALAQAVDCVAFGGTVVICSWYGTKTVQLPLGGAFHRQRLRLISSQVGSIDAALQPRWTRWRRLDLARRHLCQLDPTDLITQRVPIEQAADAYALVDAHPERTVQVVLTYPTMSSMFESPDAYAAYEEDRA
jgi:threonine dehydrogenase-like Zn-dependent dehydrogenase